MPIRPKQGPNKSTPKRVLNHDIEEERLDASLSNSHSRPRIPTVMQNEYYSKLSKGKQGDMQEVEIEDQDFDKKV